MTFNLFIGELDIPIVSPYTISNIMKKNMNVKVYSITDGNSINVMIINKDTNASFSGYVRIKTV
jgi:hypothetical protein